MASYSVNPDAVRQAEQLIDSRQYVLDSDWGKIQPKAGEQNAFLKHHSWEEYARWHLGLTDGAADQTKARYAFVYGTSGVSTAWASSPACTGPPSGGTRRLSSPPTNSCSAWISSRLEP
jgi:hypothetical protein